MCSISLKDVEDAVNEVLKDTKPFVEKLGNNLYKVGGSLICDENTLNKILK